jgi:hypothetical protein
MGDDDRAKGVEPVHDEVGLGRLTAVVALGGQRAGHGIQSVPEKRARSTDAEVPRRLPMGPRSVAFLISSTRNGRERNTFLSDGWHAEMGGFSPQRPGIITPISCGVVVLA